MPDSPSAAPSASAEASVNLNAIDGLIAKRNNAWAEIERCRQRLAHLDRGKPLSSDQLLKRALVRCMELRASHEHTRTVNELNAVLERMAEQLLQSPMEPRDVQIRAICIEEIRLRAAGASVGPGKS